MTPGAPDAEVVARHLAALRVGLQTLRVFAGTSAQQLLADLPLRWSIERGLQLCAQNTLDVSTHILSASGRDADNYASSVDGLVTLGVLPADFALEFRQMAGLRNVLVHAYLNVDLEVIVDVLNTRLAEFETFAHYVESYQSQRR